MFEDIERAKNYAMGKGMVTIRNLTDFELSKGMVHAMIYDGQVRLSRIMKLKKRLTAT